MAHEATSRMRTPKDGRALASAVAAIALSMTMTMAGCGRSQGRGATASAVSPAPITSSLITPARVVPDLRGLDLLPPGELVVVGDGRGGASRQVLADGFFGDGVRDITTQVTWRVSDPGVASVSSSGVLEGHADGVALLEVTARGLDGVVHVARRAVRVERSRVPGGEGAEPTGLEVFPSTRALVRVGAGREQTQGLVVLLVHEDGTRLDVTRAATFEVLDATTRAPSTAAALEPDGVVRGLRAGAVVDVRVALRRAHVSAAARLGLGASPGPLGPPSDAWSGEPLASSTNPLDVAALAAMRSARVEPAPLAGDEEFLRRVTSDVIGRLPTEAERAAFLADQAPDKRARLVRALLATPGFVDTWSRDFLVPVFAVYDPAFETAIRADLAHGMSLAAIVTRTIWPAGTPERDLYDAWHAGDDGRSRPADLFASFAGMTVRCAMCHEHRLSTDWPQVRGQGLFSFFAATEEQAKRINTNDVIQPAWDLDQVGIPIPQLGPDPARTVEDRRKVFAELFTTSQVFYRGTAHRIWADLATPLLDPDQFIETDPASNPPVLVQPAVLDALARLLKDEGTSLPRFLEVVLTSRLYQLTTDGATTRHDRLLARRTLARQRAQVVQRGIHATVGVPAPFSVDGFHEAQFGGRASRAVNLAQPLTLMNSPHGVAGALGQPGNQVEVLAVAVAIGQLTLEDAVRTLFRRALTRDPTSDELRETLAAVSRAPTRDALEDVAAALLESAEHALR